MALKTREQSASVARRPRCSRGCFWATTKSEGEALRKDVTPLQGRIDSKEKELDTQIAQLQSVLDDATKVLKRNSADLGADVEKLRGDIRTANGLVAAINNTINELKVAFDKYRKDNDARLDALEQRARPDRERQAEREQLARGAVEARHAGVRGRALQRRDRDLQAPRPDLSRRTTRADDAQYFRGQGYTNLKDWDNAIGAYQQLVEKYPDSALADDGLYFAALAAQQLKNCTEARTYLGLIKTKYPKSNVTKQVDELDARIKKDLKNKAKCTS